MLFNYVQGTGDVSILTRALPLAEVHILFCHLRPFTLITSLIRSNSNGGYQIVHSISHRPTQMLRTQSLIMPSTLTAHLDLRSVIESIFVLSRFYNRFIFSRILQIIKRFMVQERVISFPTLHFRSKRIFLLSWLPELKPV